MGDAPFDPIPSDTAVRAVEVSVNAVPAGSVTGVLVTSDGDVPAAVGADRDELARWGFTGRAGQTLARPSAGVDVVAVGAGPAD
ncbi:leucyl aminopeptidase, partial [Actinotalea fermentans ATCC 43279 = JCM 9966 = DSM 3133]